MELPLSSDEIHEIDQILENDITGYYNRFALRACTDAKANMCKFWPTTPWNSTLECKEAYYR
jgi:hypothetical protein